jgi:ATP synthase I chain
LKHFLTLESHSTPETRNPKLETDFYSGALERIRIAMVGLALTFTVAAFILYGWRSALGFGLGCAVAYLNFHWLKRGVTGLADRLTQPSDSDLQATQVKPPGGKGVVGRFLLRYVLMGLAAYAILTVSPASLYGLLAGLFLPVAAIACEAAYEAYVALARGT